jgi:hypothetical protein
MRQDAPATHAEMHYAAGFLIQYGGRVMPVNNSNSPTANKGGDHHSKSAAARTP